MADGRKKAPSWVKWSGIGTEFAGAIVGFVLIGYYLGRHYDWNPGATLIGAGLGIFGSMYNLIRQSLKASREMNRPKDEGDTKE